MPHHLKRRGESGPQLFHKMEIIDTRGQRIQRRMLLFERAYMHWLLETDDDGEMFDTFLDKSKKYVGIA